MDAGNRGQSLLELMLVVALLTVLAAAALGPMTMAHRTAARAAAHQLAAALARAQEQAIATGQDCFVRLMVPADQQQPAGYALRCDGGQLAWQPDTVLGPEVRLDHTYYLKNGDAPGESGVCPPRGGRRVINVNDECYQTEAPADGLELGYSPAGLRDPDRDAEVIVVWQDPRRSVQWWVAIRHPTGEVTVCRPDREPEAQESRIHCK